MNQVPTLMSELPLDPFLELNNRHPVEVGPALAMPTLARLVSMAFYAKGYSAPPGFLVVFDQDAPYDNANFQWFKARYPCFAYIDRILIDERSRGLGRARALYDDLFVVAAAAGHDTIVAEVNSDPPNPSSDAFHAALGFAVVGSAFLPHRGKTVRYLARILGPSHFAGGP